MCISLIHRETAVNLGRQKLLYCLALLLHPNPHPTRLSLPSSLWGRRRGTIFGHRAAVRVFPFPSSSPVMTGTEGQDMRWIWLLFNLPSYPGDVPKGGATQNWITQWACSWNCEQLGLDDYYPNGRKTFKNKTKTNKQKNKTKTTKERYNSATTSSVEIALQTRKGLSVQQLSLFSLWQKMHDI